MEIVLYNILWLVYIFLVVFTIKNFFTSFYYKFKALKHSKKTGNPRLDNVFLHRIFHKKCFDELGLEYREKCIKEMKFALLFAFSAGMLANIMNAIFS